MELEDIFKDNINLNNDSSFDNSSLNYDNFIENQTLQIQSICDCLLTLPKIKINYLLISFIKKIKCNISNNIYSDSYYVKRDLQKINEHKRELKSIEFNEIIKEIEQYLEMHLILNDF